MLPYFDGERTPNLPKATGLLAGLRSDVSREQIARAAVEGVVCGLLDALDALGAHAPVTAVRLVGGGARSAAYRQVVAELCELPVSHRRCRRSGGHRRLRAGGCGRARSCRTRKSPSNGASAYGTPLDASAGDTAGVRARYAELRSATHPSTA